MFSALTKIMILFEMAREGVGPGLELHCRKIVRFSSRRFHCKNLSAAQVQKADRRVCCAVNVQIHRLQELCGCVYKQ